MKNYFEQVKEDVKTWMEDNVYYFDLEEYRGNREGAEEWLTDNLWTEDSITGNGSGSYTFDREEAKEHVLNDIDTVTEALREFCVDAETIADKFLSEDWEYFDITARCYVLHQAVYEICEELEIKGAFDLEEEEEEKGIIDNVAAAVRNIVNTYNDSDEKQENINPVLA